MGHVHSHQHNPKAAQAGLTDVDVNCDLAPNAEPMARRRRRDDRDDLVNSELPCCLCVARGSVHDVAGACECEGDRETDEACVR